MPGPAEAVGRSDAGGKRRLAGDTARAATTALGGVIAPMPGQIKAILVKEGDRVKAGQKLLVMEAMKLENKIPCPKDGVVKHILVRDGDIVSQGQELVVIE